MANTEKDEKVLWKGMVSDKVLTLVHIFFILLELINCCVFLLYQKFLGDRIFIITIVGVVGIGLIWFIVYQSLKNRFYSISSKRIYIRTGFIIHKKRSLYFTNISGYDYKSLGRLASVDFSSSSINLSNKIPFKSSYYCFSLIDYEEAEKVVNIIKQMLN